MKAKIILTIICLMAGAAAFAQETRWVRDTYGSLPEDTLLFDATADSLYQLISKGTTAEVSVERAVYHTSFDDFYYLKFYLKNTGNHTIGVYLGSDLKIFYPNFVCFGCLRIGKSSEGRRIQTENDSVQLKKWFDEGKLLLIEPGKQCSYYRNFNERKEKEYFDKPSYREFGIRLDGQLLFTDGKEIELHRLDDKTEEERTVTFTYPIIQKQIHSREKNTWLFWVEDVTKYRED